jgi:hydroxypyruvate isomerase
VGVTFVLENLNVAVDHPGVPFAALPKCLALVEAVDSPHLRMMLDLYHAQIGEGNLDRARPAGRPPHRRDSGGRRAWPL